MHDDDVMDRLLGDSLRADAPQLSHTFDSRLMRRVRPRRLTAMGRVVLGAYVLVAAPTAAWLMRGLSVEQVAVAVAISVAVAAGLHAYGRRLAASH